MTVRKTRISIGDIRRAPWGNCVVLQRVRGRRGEERTLYVIGWIRAGAPVVPGETRARSHVLKWPFVGRFEEV